MVWDGVGRALTGNTGRNVIERREIRDPEGLDKVSKTATGMGNVVPERGKGDGEGGPVGNG